MTHLSDRLPVKMPTPGPYEHTGGKRLPLPQARTLARWYDAHHAEVLYGVLGLAFGMLIGMWFG